jgi:hypothetical protein
MGEIPVDALSCDLQRNATCMKVQLQYIDTRNQIVLPVLVRSVEGKLFTASSLHPFSTCSASTCCFHSRIIGPWPR